MTGSLRNRGHVGGPAGTAVWQAVAWIGGLVAAAASLASLRYRRATRA
ncbi:MAG: hypothetical protein ACRD0A_05215 [Acidimicrobiales bacterium]